VTQSLAHHKVQARPYGVRREPGPRQCLLGEDNERDNCHRPNIHNAERKENGEKKPAAAKAISTVEQAHAQRACGPLAPRRNRGAALERHRSFKGVS
jgi:hypothetical protein